MNADRAFSVVPQTTIWTWRVTFLIVVLTTWEAGARAADSLLFPSATATARALVHLLGEAVLWQALWTSNQGLLIGFPPALLAGIGTGLALARWPSAVRWFDPYLSILLATPKAAIMPIVVMALGFGLTARAGVIFTFAFPVVAVTVRAAALQVDAQLVTMARAFGATEWQVWRTIFVPGARPAILTACRLGLARAVAGMITVELLLVAVGMGQLLLRFRADFDAASVYAVVFIVIGESFGLVRVAEHVERRVTGTTPDIHLA